MYEKKLLVSFIAILSLLVFSSPAHAVTYDPDPPVAGQDLTIEHSVDWAGCTSTTGNWTYSYVMTFTAPDGTQVIFDVIDETGPSPAPAQTLAGSDTQTLPNIAGDWTVTTRTTSFCGRRGTSSATSTTVSVAEDATVPVVDPRVALALVGIGSIAFLGRRKLATR